MLITVSTLNFLAVKLQSRMVMLKMEYCIETGDASILLEAANYPSSFHRYETPGDVVSTFEVYNTPLMNLIRGNF